MERKPELKPEDVQLDVEGLAAEIGTAIASALGRNGIQALIAEDGLSKIALQILLRRVSGKGAHPVIGAGRNGQDASCPKCQSRLAFNVERVICTECDYEMERPSPAPVPATPPKRMMVAPSTGLVHEYCPDCRGTCSEYTPATTQGTPEGAK